MPSSPEKQLSGAKVESRARVLQPKPTKEFMMLLEEIGSIVGNEKPGEVSGEGSNRDLGGSGSGGAQGQQTSARDEAIKHLPAPVVMQKQLEKHIKQEIKMLSKKTKQLAGLKKPGAAYMLNELYSQIRKLSAILEALLESSTEFIRRLFIRVFVDRQALL